MIRINLLGDEFVEQKKPLNPSIPIAFLGLLLMGACGWHYTTMLKPELLSLRKQEADLQPKMNELQSILSTIDGIEKQKSDLQQRATLISQLEKERLRYPYFFETFLKILPPNLWLTNLLTNIQGTDTLALDMDVVALDNYAIADLISNLENSPSFTSVDLGPISATSQATGGETYSFHIKTTYKFGA